jgi:hypothetical protein
VAEARKGLDRVFLWKYSKHVKQTRPAQSGSKIQPQLFWENWGSEKWEAGQRPQQKGGIGEGDTCWVDLKDEFFL